MIATVRAMVEASSPRPRAFARRRRMRGHEHQADEAIRPFVDDEGIGRCRLVLEPRPIPTDWQPKRAFQGWRYYDPKDVPRDLREGRGDDLPPALRAELAELGLR